MKAFEQPGQSITLMPSATMEDNRYKFGVVNSDSQLALSGAAAKAAGVIQIPGIVGEPVRVMTTGVSFIELGDTVAAGAEVESDANGLAVTLSAGKSNGICLVGGDAGAIGCILLK